MCLHPLLNLLFLLLSPLRSPSWHRGLLSSEPQPHGHPQQGPWACRTWRKTCLQPVAVETQGDQGLDKNPTAIFPHQLQPPKRHFPMGFLLFLFIF